LTPAVRGGRLEPTMTEFENALRRLRALVRDGDVRGALALLNAGTGHRFTSLYRFDEHTLRNVWFYDCQHPERETVDDIPVLASYCVFVRDAHATFRVHDSGADARVAGHPKREQIRAYCGVPLLDDMGRMFGTICHFDFRPLAISDENVALMEALAPMLQRYSAGASRNESGISTRDLHATSSCAAPSHTREHQAPPLQ
jgi:GAF domain-containing protein